MAKRKGFPPILCLVFLVFMQSKSCASCSGIPSNFNDVVLNATSLKITAGQVVTITATVPKDTTGAGVSWTSSAPTRDFRRDERHGRHLYGSEYGRCQVQSHRHCHYLEHDDFSARDGVDHHHRESAATAEDQDNHFAQRRSGDSLPCRDTIAGYRWCSALPMDACSGFASTGIGAQSRRNHHGHADWHRRGLQYVYGHGQRQRNAAR